MSAPRAIRTMATMIATGKTGKLESRRTAGRGASARTTAVLALIADPRVDHPVEDVDEQVDEHDHASTEQHGRLHDRKVPEGDALVEQPSDPGPGEHRLHDHGHVDHDDQID